RRRRLRWLAHALHSLPAHLQHTRACSNGNGVFLLLSNSIVLLLTGANRGCMWGSCYIDAHGEEDIGLRRGRPLFLDAARVELV
ncbi:hypothetical protein ABTA52_20040, partial [Acinetobacter baumannii]